jgi:hypothetical protein
MQNESYHRLAAADKLLFCTTCFGMLSGLPVVKISNGVLIVNHLWGSREMSESTQRFRFDSKLKRFVMIGEDYEETDRGEGTSVRKSSNYLTGVKIIENSVLIRKEIWLKFLPRNNAFPNNKRFLKILITKNRKSEENK